MSVLVINIMMSTVRQPWQTLVCIEQLFNSVQISCYYYAVMLYFVKHPESVYFWLYSPHIYSTCIIHYLFPLTNPLAVLFFDNTPPSSSLPCFISSTQWKEHDAHYSFIDHLFTSSLLVFIVEHRCMPVANVSKRHLDSRILSLSISISRFSLFIFVDLLSNNNICVCWLMLVFAQLELLFERNKIKKTFSTH